MVDELLADFACNDLLDKPFRRRSTGNATRFGAAGNDVPGVYYASQELGTAAAEMAFYRLLAVVEAGLDALGAQAFSGHKVPYQTTRGVDITAPPFDAHREAWERPDDYRDTLALAQVALGAGTEIIQFTSVRDPERRTNLAVFARRALTADQPNDTCRLSIRFGKIPDEGVTFAEGGRTWTIAYRWFAENDPRLAAIGRVPGTNECHGRQRA